MVILNSDIATYFYRLLHEVKGKTFPKISLKNLSNFPIPDVSLSKQEELINLGNKMLEINKTLQNEINSFHKWLKRTFNIEKLSKKLQNYHTLTFDEFLKEVKKAKVDIKPRKTQDLLENEFNESLKIISSLNEDITSIDGEINNVVYELYGLTSDEINIVEESINLDD